MKYTNLGKTGLTVSKLCLGMMSFGNAQEWMLELEDAKPIVEKAIDLGINFFDTANVYSRGRSEEITGEILGEYDREDYILATKVRFAMGEGLNSKGLNRKHIINQIISSLNRLDTSYVDLYQIHRWDYNVNIEYVMRTLNHLIDLDYALHIGASSMYCWELAKAQYTSEKLGLEKFATMQNHFNAIYQEEKREIIPFCIDQGMGIIPWSPLARGFLSGKYKKEGENDSTRYKSDPYLKSRYFNNNDFDVLEVISEIANNHGVTIPQIALSYVLNTPGITSPIIGVTKMEHLQQAVESIDINIKPEEMKSIENSYSSRSIIGHSYEITDQMISDKNAKQ